MVGRGAYIPTAKSREEAIHPSIPSKSQPVLVGDQTTTGHYVK